MILTEYARETLGTPFKHQGRICGVGLDCAGVIQHIVKRAGLTHSDQNDYPRTPYQNLLMETLDGQDCLEIVKEFTEGCVFLMRFSRDPMHLAYFTGSTIIHAYENVGRVVEHRLDDKWKNRIVKVYRIKL